MPNDIFATFNLPIAWRELLGRTARKFMADGCLDLAAQLAYYFSSANPTGIETGTIPCPAARRGALETPSRDEVARARWPFAWHVVADASHLRYLILIILLEHVHVLPGPLFGDPTRQCARSGVQDSDRSRKRTLIAELAKEIVPSRQWAAWATVLGYMDADLQPYLLGELVELRPLREDDWEPLFQVAADPKIWEQHPNHDRHRDDVFRQFFREALHSGGALVAIDRATQRVIGSSRMVWYDEGRRTIEIGWTFLARHYWGGRHNGEMKRLMIEHAFTFARRVVFVIGPDNQRSRKAIERIGAGLTPHRETGTDAEGRVIDLVVYELLNPGAQS